MSAALQIEIPGQKPSYRGKVRDIYDLGDKLILVASDRLSAFDVVFNQGIENKGQILTAVSNHWFEVFHSVPNHLIETDVNKFPEPFCRHADKLAGRSVLVKKVKRIDIECVVRGYLLGSGFNEYTQNGKVCGISLPPGLVMGSKLPEPIFTPATKEDTGHDENISFEKMIDLVGKEKSNLLKQKSIELYTKAAAKTLDQGILLADTKLEFGELNGEIILIDEIFTPDSSRFCLAQEYEQAIARGQAPPSLDKQIVRDYLLTIQWNKQPPPPDLPQDILDKTLAKYQFIKEKILCIS